MKFTRSSLAILLFAAAVNCIPVASKTSRDVTDPSPSITQLSFATQLALANGTTVSEACNSVTVTNLETGEIIGTTTCSTSLSTDDDEDDDGSNSSDTDLSNSSAQASQQTGVGASILSTSTVPAADISGGSDVHQDSVDNSRSESRDDTAVDGGTGVGANIISTGTTTIAQPTSTATNDSSNTKQANVDHSRSGNGDSSVNGSHNGVGASFISTDSTPEPTQPARMGNVVTMSHAILTPDGPVTENCQIQLTPRPNGLFTEVQICDIAIAIQPNEAVPSPSSSAQNGPSATPNEIVPSSAPTPDAVSVASSSASPSPAPVSSSATPDIIVPSSTPTLDGVPAASSSASPPPAPVSSSASSSTTSSAAPNSPTPLSSLSPSPDPASLSPVPEPSAAADGGTGVTSLGLPSEAASTDGATPISAAADNNSSFTLPGTHISVLPVGLAIFAGISVIALIIVGAVTYERTKYRKNFRRRQLAEQLKARTDPMSDRSIV